MQECIEPPKLTNIQKSFDSLHKRNLITEATDDFEITSLGSLVVSLGVDLILGCIIGVGMQLGLLPESIEIAAILSFPKSAWLIPNALMQEPHEYNSEYA